MIRSFKFIMRKQRMFINVNGLIGQWQSDVWCVQCARLCMHSMCVDMLAEDLDE